MCQTLSPGPGDAATGPRYSASGVSNRLVDAAGRGLVGPLDVLRQRHEVQGRTEGLAGTKGVLDELLEQPPVAERIGRLQDDVGERRDRIGDLRPPRRVDDVDLPAARLMADGRSVGDVAQVRHLV